MVVRCPCPPDPLQKDGYIVEQHYDNLNDHMTAVVVVVHVDTLDQSVGGGDYRC